MMPPDQGSEEAAGPRPTPRVRPRRLAGGYRGTEIPVVPDPPDFGEAFFDQTGSGAGTDDGENSEDARSADKG